MGLACSFLSRRELGEKTYCRLMKSLAHGQNLLDLVSNNWGFFKIIIWSKKVKIFQFLGYKNS